MADVYLGIQLKLHREVAVKILKPELVKKKEFAERFLIEARTAAKLNHPNILTIYDVNDHEDFIYIVMELLNGNLFDKIKTQPERRLKPDYVLDISRQLTKALIYAHKEGVIHRDIKSDNIMFRKDNTPVLVDFGIARAIHSTDRITKVGSIVGTPFYMSPEQCQGETLDGRSDIYSLGIVIYEMLTGDVPYKAKNATGVLIKHIRSNIPKLPKFLKRFQPLLDKMLAKKKEDRFRGEGELKKWLQVLQKDGSLDKFIKDRETVVTDKIDTEKIDKNAKSDKWVFRSDSDSQQDETELKSDYKFKFKRRFRRVLLISLFILSIIGGGLYVKFKDKTDAFIQQLTYSYVYKDQALKITPEFIKIITTQKPAAQKESPFKIELKNVFNIANMYSNAQGEDAPLKPEFTLSPKIPLWVFLDLKKYAELENAIKEIEYKIEEKSYQEAKDLIKKGNEIYPSERLKSLLAEIEYKERETILNQDKIKPDMDQTKTSILNKKGKEKQYYHAAKKKNTIRNYRDYMVKYPKGMYITSAKKAIKKIKQTKIDNIKNRLKILSIRFFKSGSKEIPKKINNYLNVFSLKNTGYFFTEIRFKNNLYLITTLTSPIKIVYSLNNKPDSSYEITGEIIQEKNTTRLTYRTGIMFDSKNWTTGDYTAKIYIGDFLLGSSTFKINQ